MLEDSNLNNLEFKDFIENFCYNQHYNVVISFKDIDNSIKRFSGQTKDVWNKVLKYLYSDKCLSDLQDKIVDFNIYNYDDDDEEIYTDTGEISYNVLESLTNVSNEIVQDFLKSNGQLFKTKQRVIPITYGVDHYDDIILIVSLIK